MSPEQILFDLALGHIRKQKAPATSESGKCVYQAPDGLGCAFAPAIIDYDDRMENTSADVLLDDWSENLREDIRGVNKQLANDIQSAHDDATGRDFMTEFEEFMCATAVHYGLIYTPEPE